MPRQLLQRQAFYWGLAYSFRNLVHYHDGREHDSRHGAGEAVESSPSGSTGSRKKEVVKLGMGF